MRQSILIRVQRLTALLEAFSDADLGNADVASLLKCSDSSARNYIRDLMDAGVVTSDSNRWSGQGVDHAIFSLTFDEPMIAEFRAALANPQKSKITRSASVKKHKKIVFSSTHPNPVDAICHPLNIAKVAARRDPLVAALFGPAVVGK